MALDGFSGFPMVVEVAFLPPVALALMTQPKVESFTAFTSRTSNTNIFLSLSLSFARNLRANTKGVVL
jgi:hypothetical protein